MPISLEWLADRLQGVKWNRHHSGFSAYCPAHDDRRPSLFAASGDTQPLVLFCHAGCETSAVLKAIGLSMSDISAVPTNAYQTPPSSMTQGGVTTTYDYRDASGALVYQVLRKADKRFLQRRPDGQGGWIWNLAGVERLLYRLPELLAAAAGAWIFIPEGEKDVDTLHAHGLNATCNSGGAGKWTGANNRDLAGRKLCLLPDNDKAGRNHVRAVARSLEESAAELHLLGVRVLELPGLPTKGDVSDWFEAGGTAGDLLALADRAPHAEHYVGEGASAQGGKARPDTLKDAGKQGGKAPTQSTLIYEMIRRTAEVFTTPAGEAFATIHVNGHSETHSLRSTDFGNYLSSVFYEATEQLPGSQAKENAISPMEWDARNEQRPIFTRVAAHKGAIYIDLGDATWRAIRVDKRGWRIVKDAPVAFRRPRGQKGLPTPAERGELEMLRAFIHIEDDDWPLVAAWVVAALSGRGPYPVLALSGEQGSTKSSMARVLKELIDPTATTLRGQPADVRNLMVAANNVWVLAYDNISRLSGEVSDALCCIATGGGYTRRSLYTDADEMLIDVQRPIILTSISDIVTRPDLMDRSIPINLPAMPDELRQDEHFFWQEFDKVRPAILAGLLDVLVAALRNEPHLEPGPLPRLADFAKLAIAAEPALGLEPGAFLDRYASSRAEGAASILESAPFLPALRRVVASNGQWQGPSTALLQALEQYATDGERGSKEWPRTAHRLSIELKRLAPVMRQLQIVDAQRTRTSAERRWTIVRLERCLEA